jgi:hypothetical protein
VLSRLLTILTAIKMRGTATCGKSISRAFVATFDVFESIDAIRWISDVIMSASVVYIKRNKDTRFVSKLVYYRSAYLIQFLTILFH